MQILLGFFQVFKYPIYFLFGLILVWFVSFAYFFYKGICAGQTVEERTSQTRSSEQFACKDFL